jgi:hypothetical protein
MGPSGSEWKRRHEGTELDSAEVNLAVKELAGKIKDSRERLLNRQRAAKSRVKNQPIKIEPSCQPKQSESGTPPVSVSKPIEMPPKLAHGVKLEAPLPSLVTDGPALVPPPLPKLIAYWNYTTGLAELSVGGKTVPHTKLEQAKPKEGVGSENMKNVSLMCNCSP